MLLVTQHSGVDFLPIAFASTIYNAISDRRLNDQAPADAKIKQSTTYNLLRPTTKDEKPDDAKQILQVVSFNEGDALDTVQVRAFQSKWRPGATVTVIAGDAEITPTTPDDYVMTMSTYTDVQPENG